MYQVFTDVVNWAWVRMGAGYSQVVPIGSVEFEGEILQRAKHAWETIDMRRG